MNFNRYVGIDPSTKTGLVILDQYGKPIIEKEITGSGIDPERMRTMIEEVTDLIELTDFVCIEGLAVGAVGDYVLQMGGIAWGYRMALNYHSIGYTEIAPLTVKKFVGAMAGFYELGHYKRFKGQPQHKKEMKRAVLETYGYTHKSDNVIDAYTIAKIGFEMNTGIHELSCNKSQCEVINLLLGAG